MSNFLDTAVTPGATLTGDPTLPSTNLVVHKLTTAVALVSTVQPILDSALAAPSEVDSAWLNFMCDDGAGNGIPFYIIVNELGGVVVLPAPDPLANATVPLNQTQQCIFVPAGVEWQRRFARDQAFRAIQLSGADAFLRVETVSPS